MNYPNQFPMDDKICLVGDSGVGKTCLVTRLISGEFPENTQVSTGAVFLKKTI